MVKDLTLWAMYTLALLCDNLYRYNIYINIYIYIYIVNKYLT